ncbi:TPA: hypothetical protein ACNCG7_004986, partial [Escherichia coli]
MSYVHSKFIRLRGYYKFYPLVRISQSGNTSYPLYGINAAISAIADKKEDLNKALMRRLKSAILSRMPSRHAAYTVYQLYFT